MVYAIELIGVIFILVMFYFSYLEYRKKILDKFEAFTWGILWAIGLLLIVFHNYLNFLLKPIRFARIFDLYTVILFMFLLTLVFFLYTKNKKTEKRVEEITRGLALKDLNNLDKK